MGYSQRCILKFEKEKIFVLRSIKFCRMLLPVIHTRLQNICKCSPALFVCLLIHFEDLIYSQGARCGCPIRSTNDEKHALDRVGPVAGESISNHNHVCVRVYFRNRTALDMMCVVGMM